MGAVALAALAGCGSSDSEAGDQTRVAASATGLVAAGAPGAVSQAEGSVLPLGLSPAQVERRLGRPAEGMRRKDGFDCVFYDLVGQPAGVQLQYCFRRGELKLLSTYVRE